MRAQTTLDFAIGISIFLAVVLFTFGFIPTVLDPFDITDSENPTLADRTADTLAHGQLGSPAEPHVLDRYCTVAFFDDNPADLSDCNFGEGTVEDRLDLFLDPDDRVSKQIQITITRGGEVLCWDAGADEPTLTTVCDAESIALTLGDDPVSQDSTISARRTVSLGGEPATLEVVLW